MAANLLQKRTFTAALPVFLATPPTAEEIGQIVVAGKVIGIAVVRLPLGIPNGVNHFGCCLCDSL